MNFVASHSSFLALAHEQLPILPNGGKNQVLKENMPSYDVRMHFWTWNGLFRKNAMLWRFNLKV
jgi:hypothetical protein